MTMSFRGRERFDDELGRDMLLGERLAVLDPASEDPGYWLRFRDRVMSQAARGLAQRRFVSSITVYDVVASWGRAIVPTAALAAALAGILLLRAGSVDVASASSERALADSEPVPVLLTAGTLTEFGAADPEAF
ncbi:MAG: hypothetical protein AMS19_12025 [Gemmatimonas sp. SG8_23]|jgi:hypothetical protein|nr:MAG: hypothetical protein AMS19_12025 [Gemmatimonas sp. SG8_23]